MRTQRPFFSVLILFFVLTVAGQIVLNIPVRFGIKSLYDTGIFTNSGIFTSWKKLDASLTFIEIIDAVPDTLWAKASDGEIYIWHSSDSCPEKQLCNQWIKRETAAWLSEYTSSSFEPLLSNSSTCNGLSDKFIFFKNPPGEIAKCYFATADESNPSKDSSYYVLLSDGTILSWSHKSYDCFAALAIIYYSSTLIIFTVSTTTFTIIMLSPKNAEQKRLNVQAMKNVFLLFVLSVGGIFTGYKIGNHIVDLQTSGYFVTWELLDGPYKFKEIVDANSSGVWARTSDGNLYFWELNCHETSICKEWIETQQIPSDVHETGNGELPMVKSKTCPNEFDLIPKELPQKVVECAAGLYQTSVRFGRYYALLEDGTIWQWKTPVPNDGPNPAPLIYSFCGFITGSIIALVILIKYYNSAKKSKQTETRNHS